MENQMWKVNAICWNSIKKSQICTQMHTQELLTVVSSFRVTFRGVQDCVPAILQGQETLRELLEQQTNLNKAQKQRP